MNWWIYVKIIKNISKFEICEKYWPIFRNYILDTYYIVQLNAACNTKSKFVVMKFMEKYNL